MMAIFALTEYARFRSVFKPVSQRPGVSYWRQYVEHVGLNRRPIALAASAIVLWRF